VNRPTLETTKTEQKTHCLEDVKKNWALSLEDLAKSGCMYPDMKLYIFNHLLIFLATH
jgi:hypothetical protein